MHWNFNDDAITEQNYIISDIKALRNRTIKHHLFSYAMKIFTGTQVYKKDAPHESTVGYLQIRYSEPGADQISD